MGVVANKKYCLKTTVNHSIAVKYAGCVQAIDEITKNESSHGDKEKCTDYQKIKFSEAKAINLDCITKNKSKSMDMAVGLKNCKFVLVDFKFNAMTVPKNLEIADLKGKKDDSKKLLPNIETCILIYCDRQKQRTYLLGRKGKKKRAEIEKMGFQMMTLQAFKQTYF